MKNDFFMLLSLSHFTSKPLAFLMRKIFFIWGHFRCLESWKKGNGSIHEMIRLHKKKALLMILIFFYTTYIHAFIVFIYIIDFHVECRIFFLISISYWCFLAWHLFSFSSKIKKRIGRKEETKKKIQFLAAGLKHHHHHLSNNKSWGDFVRIFIFFFSHNW